MSSFAAVIQKRDEARSLGPPLPVNDGLVDPLAGHQLRPDTLVDPLTTPAVQLDQVTEDPTPPEDPNALIAAWTPAVVKVTDPVAFMTSAGTTKSGKKSNALGSYNQAILSPQASGGFYEQAKTECTRLIAEIGAAPAGDPRLTALVALLSDYRDLYAAIQGAGVSQKDAEGVAAIVSRMEGTVYGLDPVVLGAPATDHIVSAFNEIALFVDSWSDIKASYGGQGQVSAAMWGAFLQSVERERQILNQYGMLEERGGDATYTARRRTTDAQGNIIHDPAQAKDLAEQEGGFMTAALKSYSTHARNVEAYKRQVYEIQKRILAGEFATMEEAVEAFKQAVGGGETSPAFQEELAALARGTWSIAMAEEHQRQERDILQSAQQDQVVANDKLGQFDQASTNTFHSYVEHQTLAADRDKIGADKAWEKTLAWQTLAEGTLQDAERLIGEEVPSKLQTAANLHGEATAYIETARNYASLVDDERYPSLAGGVALVQRHADDVERELSKDAELAKQIQATNQSLALKAEARRNKADAWHAEKIEVPAPSTEVAEKEGFEVSLEHKQSFDINLKFKLGALPLWLTIGGGASVGWEEGLTSGEKWTTMDYHYTIGLELDLWIFSFYIKYVGKTEGKAKGHLSPTEVWEKVSDEKSKLDAAREIDSGGYVPKLAKAMETYPARAQSEVYDPLRKLAPAVSTGNKKARRDFNRQADESADAVEAIWGSNFVDQGYHGAIWDTFGEVAGVWEAIKGLAFLTDGSDLAGRIRSLKTAPDAEVPRETEAAEKDWRDNSDALKEHVDEHLDQLGFENDPNVKVTSKDAVEVGAEVELGEHNSAAGKWQHVWSVSDGDGEYFDTATHQSDIFAVEAHVNGWEMELEYVKNDDGSSAVKAKGKTNIGEEEEHDQHAKDARTKEVIDAAKDLATGKALSPDATALTGSLKQWFGKLKAGKGEFFGEHFFELELEFEFHHGAIEEIVVKPAYGFEFGGKFKAAVAEGEAKYENVTAMKFVIPVGGHGEEQGEGHAEPHE